ncbi:riboflavin transporter 2-like [Lytechinus pictus]|uniref:riboflavin transporter 2-like n=1 Tax=Lytechinus pictus TaxID=7653 RepID=UPI0030B9B6D3
MKMFTDALTALLVVSFGTSTWVSLGGLWVELPLLISLGIPEGYKIGSYFVMATQAAVIGPLIFVVCQYFAPRDRHLEIPAIYMTLAFGVIASFCLIFFWDFHTMWSLDDSEHSTALLILVFFMALVDSTSNLTFMPFVSRLKPQYLNWYFIGEGLSSVIPSMVVLLQGSNGDDECIANHTFFSTREDPIRNITLNTNCTTYVVQKTGHALFPPHLYYTFIFISFSLSTVSFCLLRCNPLLKDQYDEDLNSEKYGVIEDKPFGCLDCLEGRRGRKGNPEKIALLHLKNRKDEESQVEKLKPSKALSSSDEIGSEDSGIIISEEEEISQVKDDDDDDDHDEGNISTNVEDGQREGDGNYTLKSIENREENNNNGTETSKSFCSKKHILLFITLTVISSLIYGALPSIQSYSSGGYGSQTYILVTCFAEISVPFGFLFVMLRPSTSNLVVVLTAFVGIISGTYCMVVATLSPTLPLQAQTMGKVLIISAWIFQGFFFSYCRATIGWILRNDGGSRVSMMYFGGFTTIGTMIGAIIMFPLINILNIFEAFDPALGCADKVTCVTLEY